MNIDEILDQYFPLVELLPATLNMKNSEIVKEMRSMSKNKKEIRIYHLPPQYKLSLQLDKILKDRNYELKNFHMILSSKHKTIDYDFGVFLYYGSGDSGSGRVKYTLIGDDVISRLPIISLEKELKEIKELEELKEKEEIKEKEKKRIVIIPNQGKIDKEKGKNIEMSRMYVNVCAISQMLASKYKKNVEIGPMLKWSCIKSSSGSGSKKEGKKNKRELDVVKSGELHTNKRFLIITLKLKDITLCDISPEGKSSSHANIIILDTQTKEAERFDPNGIITEYETQSLDLVLEQFFKELGFLKYVSPEYFCPLESVQRIQTEEIEEEGGYCATWIFWWLELRLLNENINRKELLKMAISALPRPLTKYISDYSKSLHLDLELYLKEAGLWRPRLFLGFNSDLAEKEEEEDVIAFPVLIKENRLITIQKKEKGKGKYKFTMPNGQIVYKDIIEPKSISYIPPEFIC